MVDETTALNDLDSLIFDYKLDNINGKCDNCSFCYKKGTTLNNPFSFQLLCHRLVKNIEFAHYTIHLNGEQLKEKRCEDFIYWMLNNVIKVNGNTGQNEINNIIKELKTVWGEVNEKLKSNHVNESYLCDISNINIPLNFVELEQKKKMSDYCQNFNTLYIKLTNPNKPNCKIYYDYFNKTKDVYKEISEKCPKQGADTNSCPKLCKDKDNDPKNILSKLKCNIIEVQEQQQKLISEEQCNKDKGALSSQLQQALLAASNPVFNYSDPRIVFLILFTSWGIFLTFYYLYKRTPFSSWIRNNLQKKKIVRDNFDEEIDDEPIYDYSGSMNTNMQNAEYNISYNSDWSPSQ